MAGDDQIHYMDKLAQAVEDSVQGNQLAKVKAFFMPKGPGQGVSGMRQFELNMALARVADLRKVEKKPDAPRREVEDVMYSTLEKNGIVLPKHSGPRVTNFQPKLPQGNPVTMQRALKVQADLQAEQGR